MATYVYKCINQECIDFDKPFEKKHSMLNPALSKCESCKEEKLIRVPVKSDFLLKGKGWSKDGYSS